MAVLNRVVTTNEEVDATIAQSRFGACHRAISAAYVPETDQIAIQLAADVEIRLPRTKLQGLENATRAQLSKVEIEGPGTGLFWPEIDVAHYVPGLIEDVFGTRRYMKELARAGGTKTSPAKAAAARANGKKGRRRRHHYLQSATRRLAQALWRHPGCHRVSRSPHASRALA